VGSEAAAREEVEDELQAVRTEMEATRASREEVWVNLGAIVAACQEAEEDAGAAGAPVRPWGAR